MAKKPYFLDGKRYYEVYVNGIDKFGKRFQKRKKYDEDGKRISSERKADQVEFELKKELEGLKSGNVDWTWGAWHAECLRRMRMTYKVGTVMLYDKDLTKWLPKGWADKELQSIDKSEVYDVIFEHMVELGATANGQKNMKRRLHRLFEMAVEEGILSRNPAAGIKVKTPAPVKKALNVNEVETLLKSAQECNHRFFPVWAFALFSGMRSGEMFALRWSDVDFETGLIYVTKQYTSRDGLHPTKSNRHRVVPISQDFRRFLTELRLKGAYTGTLWRWKDEKRQEKEILEYNDFILPRLRDWRSGMQADVLRDFCRALGITEVKFHDLRATFITNLLAQGESLVKVQHMVGHSKMSTTDEYVRAAGIPVKGGTDKLGYKIPEQGAGAQVIPLMRS